MGTYLIKRLIHGIISIIIVVFIVMLLVYSLMDRTLIFAGDSNINKLTSTDLTTYQYQKWEEYGYLDYVPYSDYLTMLVDEGELAAEDRTSAATISNTANGSGDSDIVAEYVARFYDYYEAQGYTVVRQAGYGGKGAILFAYKNINVFVRLWNYFTSMISVDNIYYASGIDDSERGITITMYDPAYNTDENGNNTKSVFSPAIMGNGTYHKYLLYFDSSFPFIHQNLVTLSLGSSTGATGTSGTDVWNTMTDTQGGLVYSETIYPTGYVEYDAYDIHSATYSAGSGSGSYASTRFTDDYTILSSDLDGMSRMGYSFVIGIISVILAYLVGIPLGIVMARRHNGLIDKIGTIYIIFIMAVPSLAYIFMFQAIGRAAGLPYVFSLDSPTTLMWILPIVSLALPSIANLMKWMRRYMIDQRNSDYVKFARAGGLSEGEISRKHIMKNAAIPLVHGIPGSVLGSLTGAIITESVYSVPGVGNLLTRAISAYDNAVIVGVSLFYAVLSVVAIILGDILMALMDPRISFSSKKEKR